MTIRKITASGDAYGVGRTIGEAIAETVQNVTVHVEELVALEQRWKGSDYVGQMLAATRQSYPAYIHELQGMADGMGVTFERAFLWSCRGDLRWPDNSSPEIAAGLGESCTTLIIPATPDQPATIAHNEDGYEKFADYCFWISVKPDGCPGFDSFIYPGMIPGHTMAVNHAGIVQTINDITVHDLKPGIPRHFICRAVLDCTSVDAAIDVLKRTDRAGGFHHNLGSTTEGRLVSVEAPASGYAIKEVTDTPSAHANHLVSPELKNKEQTISQSTSARQSRADELLAQGALAEGGPTRILFESNPAQEILRTPDDASDDTNVTLATGIFQLSKDGVSYAIHDGPDKQNAIQADLPLAD
ncbi:MAG: peptidase C45 [Rhodospirillaceae bacterium]|nr:peptidase C45 [Rhodospirillaceae bacterium]MBL6929934.1 peptidase C45 [Rhodospirillales bacterium]MBL6942506.1 peptidase C45 [Rhodospirillales bacterium]